jgi:hypothetical protein
MEKPDRADCREWHGQQGNHRLHEGAGVEVQQQDDNEMLTVYREG